jgi:hypothetical protein
MYLKKYNIKSEHKHFIESQSTQLSIKLNEVEQERLPTELRDCERLQRE